jgi:hypothetical protein
MTRHKKMAYVKAERTHNKADWKRNKQKIKMQTQRDIKTIEFGCRWQTETNDSTL